MSEIVELERRIKEAMDRIGAGLDGLGKAGDSTAVQELTDALEAEKMANAQLEERVKALNSGQGERIRELEEQVTGLKAAAMEAKNQMQALRKTNQHLQASLTAIREAAAEGIEPHMLNQAMMSELEGLRAVRDSDRAELDEILTALKPMLKEA